MAGINVGAGLLPDGGIVVTAGVLFRALMAASKRVLRATATIARQSRMAKPALTQIHGERFFSDPEPAPAALAGTAPGVVSAAGAGADIPGGTGVFIFSTDRMACETLIKVPCIGTPASFQASLNAVTN
jgi:hypothetical protein